MFAGCYCQASSSGAAAEGRVACLKASLPFEENGSLPDQVKTLKIGDTDFPEPVLDFKSVPLDTSPTKTNSHGEFSILQLHYGSLSCITC
jgi:hypothetical protein